MKRILLYTVLPALLLIAGCVSSPLQGIFIAYSSHHVHDHTFGNTITSASIEKRGESCSWSGTLVDYVYFGGGGSLKEAMESAGITKVAVVDRRSFNLLLGIVYRECVVVYGE